MSEPAPTVCVTGANGFIAAPIVRALLERGYRVRGTVRSVANPAKSAHLTALPGADERLELAEADLLDEGSFDAAVDGCDAVIHTASPYAMTVDDPQADLVDPAVSGVRTVLRSCAKAPTVRRVVLTSSIGAVTDEPTTGYVFTEADWNGASSLTRNPYYYSKVCAEKTAWAFVEAEQPGFDLVAMLPATVVGPSLSAGLNPSNQILADMLTGRTYPGVLAFAWAFVDVRDVAEAHVVAMEHPSASGRYLCAAPARSMREVIDLYRANGLGSSKLPSLPLDNAVGTAFVKLTAFLQPDGLASYARTHIGRTPHYSTDKIERELGYRFRDTASTLLETAEDLARWGHV